MTTVVPPSRTPSDRRLDAVHRQQPALGRGIPRRRRPWPRASRTVARLTCRPTAGTVVGEAEADVLGVVRRAGRARAARVRCRRSCTAPGGRSRGSTRWARVPADVVEVGGGDHRLEAVLRAGEREGDLAVLREEVDVGDPGAADRPDLLRDPGREDRGIARQAALDLLEVDDVGVLRGPRAARRWGCCRASRRGRDRP